jgi:hypothetical protein
VSSSVRVQQSAPASLTWRPPGQEGEPVAATGTPTVTVTRADGTVLIPATPPSLTTGTVTLELTAAETATLDQLSVVWLLDGLVRGRTSVDVVGGFIADVDTIRRKQAPHLDAVDGPSIIERRAEVEAWFERYCRRAFVPRFTAETVTIDPGSRWRGNLVGLKPNVRDIRWVTEYTSPNTWTSIVADNTVELVDAELGLIAVPGGQRLLSIGYEHGMAAPPEDVVSAAAIAVRLAISSPRIRIDDFGQVITGLEDQDRRDLFGPLKNWKMPVVV